MNELLLRRRALMMAQKKSRLPKGYQEVEYLESTGPQYIDTGLVYRSNYTYIFTGMLVSQRQGTPLFIGAIRFGWWTSGIRFSNFVQGLKLYNYWGTGTGAVQILTSNVGLGTYFNAKLAASDFVINDTDYKFTVSSANAANEKIYVCGIIQREIDAPHVYQMRTESAAIVDNDLQKELRNFVPCYRKSDLKPGMYDLVSKAFFTNAGTGEFIVGPDVK